MPRNRTYTGKRKNNTNQFGKGQFRCHRGDYATGRTFMVKIKSDPRAPRVGLVQGGDSVPRTFHVFGEFSTTKICRGVHVYGREYFL